MRLWTGPPRASASVASLAPVASLALLLLGALSASASRRPDHDFEFEDAEAEIAAGAHRPRRYLYEPHNPLCRSLVCKKREACVLRDAYTALCAAKKDILRRGDVIERDDDVFYDEGGRDEAEAEAEADDEPQPQPQPPRCVGCGSRARAQFVCGSDNRTYSSLCRLDLHNCVRRAAPVRLACRGFCPCKARPRPRPRPGPKPRPRARASANDVLPPRRACALDEMANRLLDWFSVLMEQARAAPPPPAGFPAGCKPEVRWMFAHLDADGDGLLSSSDLYPLRHDERERCLRPFLSSCGSAGPGVSRAAWCGCLRRAARPCTALARAHPDARSGSYVPSCDSRGFYRARQCHAALGVCWCVDAHGAEVPGSRTKGAPRCPPRAPRPPEAPADDEDDDGAPSGDGPGADDERGF